MSNIGMTVQKVGPVKTVVPVTVRESACDLKFCRQEKQVDCKVQTSNATVDDDKM